MRIPVVLPTVHIQVTEDGTLLVDVDGEPHDVGRAFHRGDLRSVLDAITTARESAVRVEVQEADGTTYAGIATPPVERDDPRPRPTNEVAGGLSGAGFRPGEEVAIAYVVARRTADEDGTAALRLPPALLATRRDGLVLLGLSSRVIAAVE
jgi:hypothetical protein